MRIKQYAPTDFEINKDRREVLAVINTADVDRDNEIVLPLGLITSGINYAGRPVIDAHKTSQFPLGSILWVKPDKDKVLCKFRMSDKTEDANKAYELIQDSSLNYLSVGFLVVDESPPTIDEIKANSGWAKAVNVVRQWELLELSVCAVPANPNAKIVAKSLDCWEWGEDTIAETAIDKPIIPTPKHYRKWNGNEFDQVIQRAIKRHNASEIIARVKGLP